MHINICDTHDTIRGKMKLQVSATLLKIKSKSKTSKHLECKNCTFMIKYQNIFYHHHPNEVSLYRIFNQQKFLLQLASSLAISCT